MLQNDALCTNHRSGGQGWNRETGIKIHGDKKKQISDAERAEKQKQQWNAEKVNLEELLKTWALVKI